MSSPAQVLSDTAVTILLAKIEAISKEIRELRRTSLVIDRTVELKPMQQRALQVLREKGAMTSSEVGACLNRTRTMMTIYLNQLEALGLVDKTRRGKRVYFRIKQPIPSGIFDGLTDGGCHLFVVLLGKTSPEDFEPTKRQIRDRMQGSPWEIENISILPRMSSMQGTVPELTA